MRQGLRVPTKRRMSSRHWSGALPPPALPQHLPLQCRAWTSQMSNSLPSQLSARPGKPTAVSNFIKVQIRASPLGVGPPDLLCLRSGDKGESKWLCLLL